jgi:hypothetical protein
MDRPQELSDRGFQFQLAAKLSGGYSALSKESIAMQNASAA